MTTYLFLGGSRHGQRLGGDSDSMKVYVPIVSEPMVERVADIPITVGYAYETYTREVIWPPRSIIQAIVYVVEDPGSAVTAEELLVLFLIHGTRPLARSGS